MDFHVDPNYASSRSRKSGGLCVGGFQYKDGKNITWAEGDLLKVDFEDGLLKVVFKGGL